MRNRLLFLFVAVMTASAMLAQNSISEINRIKRDKDYLYGEATLDSKEAAIKLANELLEVEIKNWASGKDPKISSVLASKVYEYADTILLERHNMIRAFVYVKTSNLKAIKGKSLSVNVNRDKPLTKPITQQEEPQPVAKEEPQPVAKEEPQPVVKEELQPVVKEELQPVAKEELQPVVKKEPKPVVKEESGVEEEVLKRLMALNSFYDLEKTMTPLKSEGKIADYGKYSTMTDPADSYLIVYDKEANIKAFLGKGVKTRRNLKTGADDSEKNYHGCGAIWFKIQK